MLLEASDISTDDILNCDICIVGAGAAGIAIAQEFEKTDLKIILLESGGLKAEAHREDLNRGEVFGEHYPLERYRSRHFGGTTSVWGGRCVPFDSIDFKARDYVPYSGWPITKERLLPYYYRAHDYLDLGSYAYTIDKTGLETAQKPAFISGFDAEKVSIEPVYLFSPPTDFGKKYYQSLKRSNNITVVLNANCLKCYLDESGSQAERLQVSANPGRIFEVRARHFVLAAGGLGVTQLLLLSNDRHADGIGNEHGLVGQFYMGHINSHVDVQFSKERKIVWDYERTREGVYLQRMIAIPEAEQQQHGLLNQRAFVERPNVASPDHCSSVLSATYIAKSLIEKKGVRSIASHAKNIALDLNSLLGFSYKWVTKRILSDRKLPSAIAYSPSNRYTLWIDSEQVPNPASRLTLSDQKDEFGLNRLKADWQYCEQDVRSVEASLDLIDKALRQSGAGHLCSKVEVHSAPQGGHHLGTTRMSLSPQTGVVDAECRVHGVNNLYVASSSMFATSSYANPTLTIVALAIRLADRLKSSYQK